MTNLLQKVIRIIHSAAHKGLPLYLSVEETAALSALLEREFPCADTKTLAELAAASDFGIWAEPDEITALAEEIQHPNR